MRFVARLATLGWLISVLSFAAVAQSTATPQQAPNTPVCAGCHEDKWTSTALSAHGAKNDAQGSMCQACHGDATDSTAMACARIPPLCPPYCSGKAKPANPFSRLTPATATDQSNVCLACHTGNRQLTFWESGKHAKQDVTCANCHSIHGKERTTPVAPFTKMSALM